MKPTERFSDRVVNYTRYRPSYPLELVDALVVHSNLRKDSTIADIGSGTGKLTELLLNAGYRVTGVEPNKEMREAAEVQFKSNADFYSVAGESNATGLEAESVDLITAAQAFHWFEPDSTKTEFERIVKPGGHIALIWNRRDLNTAFQKDYDQLLSVYCAEYSQLNHQTIGSKEIEEFFKPDTVEQYSFPYEQTFDEEGFLGRMFSSSYTPKDGSAEALELSERARQLFQDNQQGGAIKFSYQTNLYISCKAR